MKRLKTNIQGLVNSMKALIQKAETLKEELEKMDKTGMLKKATSRKIKTKPVKENIVDEPVATENVKTENPLDKETAYEMVVGMIKRSKKGVNTEQIKKKTGFDAKKVANIIYKARKKGEITSTEKGFYHKA